MSRLRAGAARLTARKSGLVVLGIVVGALVVPQGAAFAVKAVQDVLVTNTADNPVPTKAVGTSNVAGTVAVKNGTDGPLEVKQVGGAGAGQLYHQTKHFTVNGTFGGTDYTFPAGKRLSVSEVSCSPALGADELTPLHYARLHTNDSGTTEDPTSIIPAENGVIGGETVFSDSDGDGEGKFNLTLLSKTSISNGYYCTVWGTLSDS